MEFTLLVNIQIMHNKFYHNVISIYGDAGKAWLEQLY